MRMNVCCALSDVCQLLDIARVARKSVGVASVLLLLTTCRGKLSEPPDS